MKNKYRNTSRRKTPWDQSCELSPLEVFIKSNYLDTFNTKHPRLMNTNEAVLLNSFEVYFCKHCTSSLIVKRGHTKNGIQRYVCKECGRTFNILTNTLFDNHKISVTEWIEFCLNIFRYESISVTSKTNKNSFNTSKYWLHKLFLVLEDIQDCIVLQGTVQIDETFFSVIKSDKIMKDGKQLRGLSKNQHCIGIGYDGTNVYAHLEGFGKTSQKKTMETFYCHIKQGSHLIHDKEKSHRILVNKLQLIDEVYDANDLKKLDDKDNPLDPINNQCDLLKRFLSAHNGFDREDFQNYLNLFCFIQNPPYAKLEKVEILLNSAIHLTKSLKYRDFYVKKP